MSLSFEPYLKEYENLRFLLENFEATMHQVSLIEEETKCRIKSLEEQAKKMGLDITCDEGRNRASQVREKIGVWLDCSYKSDLKAYTCRTNWWGLRGKIRDLPLYWPVTTGTFKGLTLKCRVGGGSGDGWRLENYVTKAFQNGYSIHTFTEEDMKCLLKIQSLIKEIEGMEP